MKQPTTSMHWQRTIRRTVTLNMSYLPFGAVNTTATPSSFSTFLTCLSTSRTLTRTSIQKGQLFVLLAWHGKVGPAGRNFGGLN